MCLGHCGTYLCQCVHISESMWYCVCQCGHISESMWYSLCQCGHISESMWYSLCKCRSGAESMLYFLGQCWHISGSTKECLQVTLVHRCFNVKCLWINVGMSLRHCGKSVGHYRTSVGQCGHVSGAIWVFIYFLGQSRSVWYDSGSMLYVCGSIWECFWVNVGTSPG